MLNTVDKVLKIANDEVGYLEKKSNSQLENKTANAGSKNYTKYGKWIGMNGQFWCASFICWIFYFAYGVETAKKLLYGNFSASCEVLRQQFIKAKKYGKNAKVGSVIFFNGTRHDGANHIGIVYQVDSKYVYTIEGNTSGGSTVIDNGGSVAKKRYLKTNINILGYGYPKYDIETIEVETKVVKTFNGSEIVRKCQVWLNTFSCNNIKEDGFYGTETKVAIIKVLQTILREDYKKGLVKVNGKFDLTTKNNIVSCKLKTYGRLVKLIECYLFCTGYNPQDFNGNYVETVANAVYEYQEKNKLDKDKIWGKQCWTTALK